MRRHHLRLTRRSLYLSLWLIPALVGAALACVSTNMRARDLPVWTCPTPVPPPTVTPEPTATHVRAFLSERSDEGTRETVAQATEQLAIDAKVCQRLTPTVGEGLRQT